MKGLIVQFLPKKSLGLEYIGGAGLFNRSSTENSQFFWNEKIDDNQTRPISIVNHNKTEKQAQEL